LSKSYHFVRFRWLKPLNLDEVALDLAGAYSIEKWVRPRDDREITLYGNLRDEVTATADTLAVILNPYRAILFQRESKPFTTRDESLRTRVFEMYDKSTPTPFPWGGDTEPKYVVEG